METYYHGTTRLFNKFDLNHALEGDGKVKFGYGVYVTQTYRSAALYAGKAGGQSSEHYVYTVEVPGLTPDNHIRFKVPVAEAIVSRTEKKLGKAVPAKVVQDGKDFRKWLAKELSGSGKVDVRGEKAAAEFLDAIGVIAIVWPYSWRNPDSTLNRAVFNYQNVKIIKIERVELDAKGEFIPGSEQLIKAL